MNRDTRTEEYFRSMAEVKLASSVRARMREDLSAYADYHAAAPARGAHTRAVRESAEGRSLKHVRQNAVWTTLFTQTKLRYMHANAIVLIALTVTGGGTMALAQNSVPGDTLYPVKIHVNENMRGAFAIGSDAEARLQAELLKERVEEAEELAAAGRLEGEVAATAETNIVSQAEAFQHAAFSADADVATAVRADLSATLAASANVFADAATSEAGGTDDGSSVGNAIDTALGLVATGSASGTVEAGSDTDTEAYLENAEQREAALRTAIEADANLDAGMRTEFMTKLDAAADALAEARTSFAADAHTQAEANVDAALEFVAEVESAVSAMGDVLIDSETGAIIDIDASGDSAADTDRNVSGEGVGSLNLGL